jgi:predicted transcriptional regulator
MKAQPHNPPAGQAAPEPMADYVRRRLQELKGQWPEVSRRSGVPYFTMSKFTSGAILNPRINTVQALHDVLREMEKEG